MNFKTDTVIFCDGACEPVNPGGTAAYGWVIYWQGKRARDGCGVVCSGPEATNNVAEYQAVIKALEYLRSKDFTGKISVCSDSRLIINQLSGLWNVSSPHLKKLWKQTKDLAAQFEHVSYYWIPREQNTEADAMSRRAYGVQA